MVILWGNVHHVHPDLEISKDWRLFLRINSILWSTIQSYSSQVQVHIFRNPALVHVPWWRAWRGSTWLSAYWTSSEEYIVLHSNHEETDTRIILHAIHEADLGADTLLSTVQIQTCWSFFCITVKIYMHSSSIFPLGTRENMHYSTAQDIYSSIHIVWPVET